MSSASSAACLSTPSATGARAGRDFMVGKVPWALLGALLSQPPRDNTALRLLLDPRGDGSLPALPAALAADADIATFSCGVESLDAGLRQDLEQVPLPADDFRRRAFAITLQGRVVGYYSQRVCYIRRVPGPNDTEPAPAEPVVLLARLAVDRHAHGQGLGSALLRDAVRRALAVGPRFGARAMLVHALSEDVRRFYLAHGFQRLPPLIDALGVMVSFQDARRALAAAESPQH